MGETKKTLKDLRQEAKALHIPNWWNMNTEAITKEIEKRTAKPKVSEISKTSKETEAKEDKKTFSKHKRTELGRDKVVLSKYCKERGLPYHTIYDRIVRLGWDEDRALTTPVRKKKEDQKKG